MRAWLWIVLPFSTYLRWGSDENNIASIDTIDRRFIDGGNRGRHGALAGLSGLSLSPGQRLMATR